MRRKKETGLLRETWKIESDHFLNSLSKGYVLALSPATLKKYLMYFAEDKFLLLLGKEL